MPQGVERKIGRVRAAYTDQNLVFEHSLQAIAFPPSKRATAKLITALLNSRLAAWFYFHETANLGTDRAKVIQTDLLKLPFAAPKAMPDPARAAAAAKKIVRLIDRESNQANALLRSLDDPFDEVDALVYEYYGLDGPEVAIIEDSFDYIIPAMQPRRSAGMQPIWDNSRQNHRSAYAATLCDALKPWFSAPISAALAAKSSDIGILKLTLDKAEHPYKEEISSDADQFLRDIGTNLPIALPGNVQVVPDLRFVIGKDMYLVKPMQLRHWLRSAALADAEQIAVELSAIVAREDKREARDARR